MNRNNIVQAVGTIPNLNERLGTIEGSALWQNRESDLRPEMVTSQRMVGTQLQ